MKKKTIADSSQTQKTKAFMDALDKSADPGTMLHATQRANAGRTDQTKGYFYGNLGDSIERRMPSGGGLGGGSDIGHGQFGVNSSYPSVGYGNFYGAGLGANGRNQSGGHAGGMGGAGGFQYLNRYASVSAFNHSIIASCILAYLGYGVIRNIIDLYSDFATEGLIIEHPNKSVRNFYNAWAKKVRLKERIHNIFMNMFITGNVFIHRSWATLDNGEQRAMKRSEGALNLGDKLVVRGKREDTTIDPEIDFMDWFLTDRGQHYVDSMNKKDNALAASSRSPQDEALPEKNGNRIPWGYTTLNPLQMDVRGRKIKGEHYWVMLLDRKDTMDIAKGMGMFSSNKQDLGITEVNLPKEFANKVKPLKSGSGGYVAEIKLDEESLSVIQDRKFDWFDWSVPFVYPSLRALSFKDCLRDMETRACYSVINSIFLFKLGDLVNGMPAEEEHFERLADMLQQPGQVMNIIWNEAIEAEVIQADIKGIFDPKKHESADKDILTALGVPEVLLGGKGGNFSNSFIAVSTILEKLESARDRVLEWLMGEMKVIADVMGFKKLPTVRFGNSSLTDRKSEQAFMTSLFDRGILSADSLLAMADTDVEIEASKQKEEQELQDKKAKVMEHKGPFIKEPPKPMAGAGPKKPAAKKATKPNGRPNGSDTGPTGKQSNPRGPKGQGLATTADVLELYDEYSEVGRAMLDSLESRINDKAIASHNKHTTGAPVKYMKQLPAEERDRLENMVYNVFSHMPPAKPNDFETDDFLVTFLKSDAVSSIKLEVLGTYDNKLKAYQDRWGKAPAREQRRQMMVSAWTQFAITQHLGSGAQALT